MSGDSDLVAVRHRRRDHLLSLLDGLSRIRRLEEIGHCTTPGYRFTLSGVQH